MFACKVIFMGIVCPPYIRDDNELIVFDGKTMLKQVSKQAEQKHQSHNQSFVPQYKVNHRLKEGKSKHLYPEDMDIF